jgi:uncharacterized DUF497 family protein
MVKKLYLPDALVFDWDPANLEHIKKHKVEYNECEDIFFIDPIYFADEKHSQNEERYLAYGITNEDRLLTLVFTIRNSKIRIVSARDQNKKEKEIYKLNKHS